MKIYYYLFYRIYSNWKKMRGKDHAFSAMAALSLLLGFDILTALHYFGIFIKYSYKQLQTPIIIGGALLLALNYLIFIKDERYVDIEKMFVNESKMNKILGNIGMLVYAIVSFILMFVVL